MTRSSKPINPELLAVCKQVVEIEEATTLNPWKSVWRLFSLAESVVGRKVGNDAGVSLATSDDRLAAIGIVSWIADVAAGIVRKNPDHHYSADPTDFSDEAQPVGKINQILRSLLSGAVRPYFNAINEAEKTEAPAHA